MRLEALPESVAAIFIWFESEVGIGEMDAGLWVFVDVAGAAAAVLGGEEVTDWLVTAGAFLEKTEKIRTNATSQC